jgi:hypothetical protein
MDFDVMYLSDNLIPDSTEVKKQAGWWGAQHTQLQPFSVHFKNIIIKLTGLCCFFNHWRNAKCQEFLKEINHKRTHKM